MGLWLAEGRSDNQTCRMNLRVGVVKRETPVHVGSATECARDRIRIGGGGGMNSRIRSFEKSGRWNDGAVWSWEAKSQAFRMRNGRGIQRGAWARFGGCDLGGRPRKREAAGNYGGR